MNGPGCGTTLAEASFDQRNRLQPVLLASPATSAPDWPVNRRRPEPLTLPPFSAVFMRSLDSGLDTRPNQKTAHPQQAFAGCPAANEAEPSKDLD
jgi:hypothetical protein